jgi:hypothetical protein
VLYMYRVGQNRKYTPYMTVYLMVSLPKIPYIHRIYMVLANPIYVAHKHRECDNGCIGHVWEDCTLRHSRCCIRNSSTRLHNTEYMCTHMYSYKEAVC